MFVGGRTTIFLGLIIYVTAHNSKDDAAFELEKNQTHSLRGLKTGGSLSATNFLKISGFKPLATKLPKKVISSKALSGLTKSPKSVGRKLSTGEASKKSKLHVHDDGSSETRRKSTASEKSPFGRSLIGTDDDDDQETNPVGNLFGASLLINPKKPKPIEVENGMGGRSFSEVHTTPSKKVVIQDDIDESAEEATTTASQTKGAGGIFAGSMIAPKESENIPEGRAFTEESDDERIEDDDSEQKVPNSEKWKSVNPETLPEKVQSADYDVTTIVPHSHKKFDNFPAQLSVLEMTQTDELFSCDDKRGTLSPIANNSKFFADPRLLYTYEEAKKLCMQKELVLAELMDWPDHWSIQSYVGSFGNNAFYIGPNDIRKEGVFKRSDNGKAITFQNYHTSQPDDRNMSEDCTTVSRERKGGPVGSSDDDCFKSFHVLCMFPAYSKCFNNSKEAIAIFHMERNYSLNLVVNASERAYFVSNFQLSWANAHDYCRNHSMALYNMDAVTNMGFFRAMVRWETKLLEGIPAPPLQYWTSGKFKKTHMNAEIYWYHKPYLTESEERVLAKTSNFTFSGVFKWSDKKKKDAGAPYIWRKDLCLSFAFEASPEPTPFVRNTNCDMPGYFVCMEDYDIDGYPADSK